MTKKSTTVPVTPFEIAARKKSRTNTKLRTAQRALSEAQTALRDAQEAVTEAQTEFLVASREFSKLKGANSSKRTAKVSRAATEASQVAQATQAFEPGSWTIPVVMNGRPVMLKCRAKTEL